MTSLSEAGALRTGCKLFAVLSCLAAVGCAPLPEGWIRLDKRQIDSKQLFTDRAICESEIKANLSTSSQTTIWGPTEDAIAVYTECMARHGYRLGK